MKRSNTMSQAVPLLKKQSSMRNLLNLSFLLLLPAVTLTLFLPSLQAQRVYINDNVPSPANHNTVYGFVNTYPTLTPITWAPWTTGGTSLLDDDPTKDQAIYEGYGAHCLYVAEPLPSTGRPNGDIAAFRITPTGTNKGDLTLVNRFANPAGNKGTTYGIALATRIKAPALFAGYSTSNTIVSWEINLKTCGLTAKHQIAVFPLNTGWITGMAESSEVYATRSTLVATYNDGSIQSFHTPAGSYTITPDCAVAIDSTGYTDGNNSEPAGVDITKDGKYAIFGDRVGNSPPHGPTELETVALPITCSSVTTDFGGTIVASGSSLGSNIDSTNLWLSPNEKFIYVTNNGPNSPQGFTTVAYNETFNTMSLATGCTSGFGNPISLHNPSGGFFEPNGIQTSATTGNGTNVYVGEYISNSSPPSAVALLDVDASGCTQEVSGSPFSDPSGNHAGANQLSAWPPRPF